MNARDINNVTPLHSLSFRGHTDCIELLIINGADIGAKDASGLDALFYAAYGGQKGAAEVLISNGAIINARNKDGLTPADIAKDGGYAELARFFISKGGELTPVKDPEVINLSPNIYMITFSYNQYTNIIVYEASDSVLIIDTGFPRTSEKLKSTIGRIAEGREKVIINTHLHIDHIGGNGIADDEDKIINFQNLDHKVSNGVLMKGKGSLKGKSGKVFDIFPESTKFIAGYGRYLTMKEFKDYQKMLLAAIEIVKNGMNAGKSVEDMQKEKVLKDYESYNTFIPELNTDFWIGAVCRSYEH